MLLGRVRISDERIESPSVIWIKEAGTRGKIDLDGVTNKTSLVGERYVSPTARQSALELTTVTIILEHGNLNAPLIDHGILDNKRLAFSRTNKVSLSFLPATGFLKGTFLSPVSGKKSTLQGAVLQGRKMAGGFFFGKSESGRVTLQENAGGANR